MYKMDSLNTSGHRYFFFFTFGIVNASRNISGAAITKYARPYLSSGQERSMPSLSASSAFATATRVLCARSTAAFLNAVESLFPMENGSACTLFNPPGLNPLPCTDTPPGDATTRGGSTASVPGLDGRLSMASKTAKLFLTLSCRSFLDRLRTDCDVLATDPSSLCAPLFIRRKARTPPAPADPVSAFSAFSAAILAARSISFRSVSSFFNRSKSLSLTPKIEILTHRSTRLL